MKPKAQYWAAPTSWPTDHCKQDLEQSRASPTSSPNGTSFRFWFSTTKNAIIHASTETYAPCLGFCPFALTGNDAKMPQRSNVKDLKAMGVDPDQWLIHDERLLVFRGPEALRLFGRDFAANMEKASQNWELLIAAPKCSSDELYNTQCFRTDKGVPAVGGVDVVAFFSLAEGDKPVEGSSKYPFQLTTTDDRGHALLLNLPLRLIII